MTTAPAATASTTTAIAAPVISRRARRALASWSCICRSRSRADRLLAVRPPVERCDGDDFEDLVDDFWFLVMGLSAGMVDGHRGRRARRRRGCMDRSTPAGGVVASCQRSRQRMDAGASRASRVGTPAHRFRGYLPGPWLLAGSPAGNGHGCMSAAPKRARMDLRPAQVRLIDSSARLSGGPVSYTHLTLPTM